MLSTVIVFCPRFILEGVELLPPFSLLFVNDLWIHKAATMVIIGENVIYLKVF